MIKGRYGRALNTVKRLTVRCLLTAALLIVVDRATFEADGLLEDSIDEFSAWMIQANCALEVLKEVESPSSELVATEAYRDCGAVNAARTLLIVSDADVRPAKRLKKGDVCFEGIGYWELTPAWNTAVELSVSGKWNRWSQVIGYAHECYGVSVVYESNGDDDNNSTRQ